MRSGAMTILFRELPDTDRHIGYIESLERLNAAGFRVADLNLCQLCAHKTTLHTDAWRSETEKLAEAIARLGMDIPQCHLPFKSKKVKWKTPEDYEYYMKMFYRAIDVAALLGIPWGVVHPETFRDSGLTDDEKIAGNHREYDAPVDYALSRGLSVAFENMLSRSEDSFCARAEQLIALTDSYGDSRIGICWDTGHANTVYSDQYEPLTLIGSRLHCTHIDDNRGHDDLHELPFEGTVKWGSVMRALRDIRYPGELILEVSTNYRSPVELKDENGRHAFAVAECLLGYGAER